MNKLKKYSLSICCFTIAFILFVLAIFHSFVGNVSAKYVMEYKLDDPIAVEKNYYTVTYYQYDDMPLHTIDELGNVTHSLRDGTGVILPENAESFLGWVTALGVDAPNSISKSMSLFPSFKYNETIYTVRFMDMKGETLVASATFKESQVGQTASSVITAPEGPILSGEDLEFTVWGVREGSSVTAWKDYKLPASDVTVYAQYEYSGELNLTPVDTDGDGTVDEYHVNSAAGLSGTLEVPGYINGLPVAVIVDISDNGSVNGLLGDGITKVIFNDGTTTIKEGALAYTADLETVVIPSSVTTIESNAFASTMGGAIISKTLTITYDGTWEEFQAIAKDGWESGLATGTTVVCTNGVATLTARTILGFGYYSWDFEANS